MVHDLTITFWGVRGSYPVPGSGTVQFGGNTPCVEVRAGNQVIILDAGTGIIGLGKALVRETMEQRRPLAATLLFSHMHHDHTQGFPFFTPAYMGTTRLNILGPGIFERDLEETLARAMLPPVFPISLQELPSAKTMTAMRECDVLLLGDSVGGMALRNRYRDQLEGDPDLVRIQALHSYAHPGTTLVYRIDWRGQSVVYATDIEGYAHTDRRLATFAHHADVLIHDAQYTEDQYLGRRSGTLATQGWGHSTAAMACDVAHAANVKQLVLFHHDPGYDDPTIQSIESDAQGRFANTISGYEGLVLRLGASASAQAVPEPATADHTRRLAA
jgi:phosphoribosyl 1,2-cyclic phosphodiesterase